MVANDSSIVILKGRDAPPSHYVVKFDSFSLLSKDSTEEFADKFDAGGFKWKLTMYPTGYKMNEGKKYISIYLELLERSSLPAGWEVNVISNFFILNQLQNKYFGLEDGSVKRYHAMKTSWGVDYFIDADTFNNGLNGYLVNNSCVFGAEVFVVKSTCKGQRLSMINEPATCYHTWKVRNFSTLLDQSYESEPFGNYNWKLLLYPNGCGEGKGNCISLFLSLDKSCIPLDAKLFVKFVLRVKDQMNEKHVESGYAKIFAPSVDMDWGARLFMTSNKLKDPNKYYLVHDTCFIEAEVTLRGLVLTES